MKCVECGYLALREYVGDRFEYTEWNRSAVTRVGHLQCYRHRWSTGPDDDPALFVQSEISRNRVICRTAYPFSEGTPEEHRISHRARTTRRWLIAGGLFGPFVATTAGAIGVRANVDVVATASVVGGAAIALGIVVLAVNLLLIRD